MYKRGRYKAQEFTKKVALYCALATAGLWIASYSLEFYGDAYAKQWGVSRGSIYFERFSGPASPPRKTIDWTGAFIDGPRPVFDAEPSPEPLWQFEIDYPSIRISLSLLLIWPFSLIMWAFYARKSSKRGRRLRDHACIQCGYPLLFMGSSACSECGISSEDQVAACDEFVHGSCGGRVGRRLQSIIGILAGIVILVSLSAWAFLDSTAWVIGDTQIGETSGWFVLEQQPTRDVFSCFKNGEVIDSEEWLIDYWLSWDDYARFYQIRLSLPFIAIAGSAMLGWILERHVLMGKKSKAFARAMNAIKQKMQIRQD